MSATANMNVVFPPPKTMDSDQTVTMLATQIRWWEGVGADLMEDETKSS